MIMSTVSFSIDDEDKNTHSCIPKENDGLGRSFRFKEKKSSTRRGADQSMDATRMKDAYFNIILRVISGFN
jgi:hypothetical protein